MKNKKAFTLIELLVVVLIIAILAAIALPKYQVVRDRAHLSGLMTIGKNINDAMDRVSLFNSSAVTGALNLLDISFKNNVGSECTGTTCRVTMSGKDYNLVSYLNYGGTQNSNFVYLYPYSGENPAFGLFAVNTETRNSSYTYQLYCYQISGTYQDPDEDRCLRLGKSLGASNAECDSSDANPRCYFN